jgi:hypothetical protein
LRDLKEIKINSKCRFDREIKRSLSPRGKKGIFSYDPNTLRGNFKNKLGKIQMEFEMKKEKGF